MTEHPHDNTPFLTPQEINIRNFHSAISGLEVITAEHQGDLATALDLNALTNALLQFLISHCGDCSQCANLPVLRIWQTS